MTSIAAMLGGVAALLLTAELPIREVRCDNARIEQSCRVVLDADAIADVDGDGVIHITGSDVVVDFAGAELRGAARGTGNRAATSDPSHHGPPALDQPGDGGLPTSPDAYVGVGIRITGKNVTLRNAKVSGYKCGIRAVEADGLTLEGCDVSDNFRQRLRSTPQVEDGADWLWPHRNDDQEWRRNYGAGVCIERSRSVTIRECRARHGQNGIVLDRVTDSRVYDNDFSFLSGWGLAMWRSSRNVVSRNAFDFCVRGYSHGVYNRGQDSAGILMFEQCCDNVIAENSATHGGDGFFGFAGREALGEAWMDRERERLRKETGKDDVDALIEAPPDVIERHRRRGCNKNILFRNDFSYAPAHGIEITFSFENVLAGNRLVENAICGVWGGYSQETVIEGNEIVGNGAMAYGLERGGVNIEHGRDNRIFGNRFRDNRCGVHLWWDDDGPLGRTPWARANGTASTGNRISHNEFVGDELALHLRGGGDVGVGLNRFEGVTKVLDASPDVAVRELKGEGQAFSISAMLEKGLPERPGRTRPVGARPELRGRDRIIMTQWGPYDWESPFLQFLGAERNADDGHTFHVYRLLGSERIRATDVGGLRCKLETGPRPDGTFGLRIAPAERGVAWPYAFTVTTDSRVLKASGMLVDCTWHVRVFAWKSDPREDLDAWQREARSAVEFATHELNLKYGMGGPSDLPGIDEKVKAARLPRERFGTIATTALTIPAGRWTITTTSDDGVRVWADDLRIIDNWTWHGPTRDTGEFEVAEPRKVDFRVEHFELDGYAVLAFELSPDDEGPAGRSGASSQSPAR